MKGKLALAVTLVAVAFFWFRASAGRAPLADGGFLLYQQGTWTVRLTFHRLDGDAYRTAVELTDEDGTSEVGQGMPGHDETVDTRLRTASGGLLELGSFGPVWVSPAHLKEGGNAYGSRVAEIRSVDGRDVAVVSASVGGGALRGEWLYDVATGFLVGGMMGTVALAPGQGQGFTLVDSNVPGLDGR